MGEWDLRAPLHLPPKHPKEALVLFAYVYSINNNTTTQEYKQCLTNYASLAGEPAIVREN